MQPNAPNLTKPVTPINGQGFQDDFSSPSSGWTSVTDNIKESVYVNGVFSLTVKKLNAGIPIVNHNAGSYKDMSLETDARLLSGQGQNLYGLVFRYRDDDNYYCFMVSGDGGYTLEKRVNGTITQIIKKTPSASVKKDNSFNSLEVVCTGDKIELFCNGSHLETATDNSFSQGLVGIIVSAAAPPANAVFDNFKVSGT